MFKLACKDLGADCDFEAQGATKEEAMEMMMKHATEAHPEKMEEMKDMPEAEVSAMMMGKMQEMA